MNTTAKGALPVDETIDIEDVNRRMAAGEEVSAEEYMAFVRHEAAGLDDIMELDKSDSRAQQIAVERREAEAMRTGGVVFAAAGPALVATALSGHWPAWYRYITGRPQVPSRKAKAARIAIADSRDAGAAAAGGGGGAATPPSTEAVASLSDLEATRLFRRVAVHIVHHAITIEEPVAAWLYAVLLRLPEPLHPDTASSMRDLLRQLCEMRAWMEDTGARRDVLLASINTLVVAICLHFGQGEPWRGSY